MNKNNKLKCKRKRQIFKSPYFNDKPISCKEDNDCISSTRAASLEILTVPRMTFLFFNMPCVDLAKSLLGKVLVRVSNGIVMKGRIVETESYLGGDDKASISYGGKITEKSKPMYMKPGTTFVYLTYGMYNLINISSKGDGAAVLLRALDPVDGIEQMLLNRNAFQPYKSKQKKESKDIPVHQLCNGPAKLCISLGITKESCNMQDLSCWSDMWIEQGESVREYQIVKSRRIGIDSAGQEWVNKLLRFYVINNRSISKRDKAQEASLLSDHCNEPVLLHQQ